jgi:hypothetical protein
MTTSPGLRERAERFLEQPVTGEQAVAAYFVACDIIRALLASPAPVGAEGWVLVPKEATAAMLDAAGNAFLDATLHHVSGDMPNVNTPFRRFYRAIIDASPAPAQATPDPDIDCLMVLRADCQAPNCACPASAAPPRIHPNDPYIRRADLPGLPLADTTATPPAEPSEDEVDTVAWAMLGVLHSNIPEADRPQSWSDLSEEQAVRVRDATKIAIAAAKSSNYQVCHVCGESTQIACSDCQINFSATVYVCSKASCRDAHDIKCYGPGDPATPPAEAREGLVERARKVSSESFLLAFNLRGEDAAPDYLLQQLTSASKMIDDLVAALPGAATEKDVVVLPRAQLESFMVVAWEAVGYVVDTAERHRMLGEYHEFKSRLKASPGERS